MAELVVNRRIPTYDFTIHTPHSVEANRKTLEAFLRSQSRPRGFVLFSSQVHGSVAGSTFQLFPPEAALHGSTPPVAEGYFVPDDRSGSFVVVRVQSSSIVYGVLAFVVLFASISFFFQDPSLESVAMFLWLAFAGFLFCTLPAIREGSRVSQVLLKLFA